MANRRKMAEIIAIAKLLGGRACSCTRRPSEPEAVSVTSKWEIPVKAMHRCADESARTGTADRAVWSGRGPWERAGRPLSLFRSNGT